MHTHTYIRKHTIAMQYLVWIRIRVQLLLRKLTEGPTAAAVRFFAQSVVFQTQCFLFSDYWEGAA